MDLCVWCCMTEWWSEEHQFKGRDLCRVFTSQTQLSSWAELHSPLQVWSQAVLLTALRPSFLSVIYITTFERKSFDMKSDRFLFGNLLKSLFSFINSVNCYVQLSQYSSLQSLSRVQLFETPWTTAHQTSLFITSSQNLPKPMSIELVMPSNHFILCRPLLLLPSIFPSIRVFSNESALCIRWPKYWSFSFTISPSKEHPGLISFRMDWLDLEVQGTLKSLLQHHSSKASILGHSAFFIVHLSHPFMTTGKTVT